MERNRKFNCLKKREIKSNRERQMMSETERGSVNKRDEKETKI